MFSEQLIQDGINGMHPLTCSSQVTSCPAVCITAGTGLMAATGLNPPVNQKLRLLQIKTFLKKREVSDSLFISEIFINLPSELLLDICCSQCEALKCELNHHGYLISDDCLISKFVTINTSNIFHKETVYF